MVISLNKVVSFRFIMYDARGNMIENNHSGNPVSYLHGGNTVENSLQRQLEGLSTGETGKVELRTGGGQYHCTVMVEAVREATETEILLGYPIEAGEICAPDCECFIPET